MPNKLIYHYKLTDLEKVDDQTYRYKGHTIKGPTKIENGPLPYYMCIIYDPKNKRIGQEQDTIWEDSLKFSMRHIDHK
jgi:hypothetical protein